MIEKINMRYIKYKIEHYKGSLDFPCDFCGNNSYVNIHLSKGDKLEFVVCKDCLEKVMKQ